MLARYEGKKAWSQTSRNVDSASTRICGHLVSLPLMRRSDGSGFTAWSNNPLKGGETKSQTAFQALVELKNG